MFGLALPLVRLSFFWAIVFATVLGAWLAFPWIDAGLVSSTISNVYSAPDEISRPEFAYALAGLLGAIALGNL